MATTTATAMRRPQPHAVVVPYPCSGNINPALQLAKLLHQQGVYVTFVNTEHNHRRMLDAEGADALTAGGGGIRFETIPDGLTDAERATQDDYGLSLSVATSTRCAAPLRKLIARLNAGGPPVTCVVPTFLMSFALDVAAELRIPSMVLWGCSAGALLCHMKLGELRERGCIPVKDADDLDTIVDWIPGLPAMPLGDFSGFLRKLDDPANFRLRFDETEVIKCTKAGALILNTFDDLEPDALAELGGVYKRVYSIGPLGSLLRASGDDDDDDRVLSLWKRDETQCLAWLESQEPGSVVYVSFGSHAVLTPAQVTELALGLAASRHPFLWAVRESLVAGGDPAADAEEAVAAALPPEFFAGETRFCLTSWCPQEEVLGHRAVGCFLTHGGWNSTCEGIAAGVPMVFWPGSADQYTNATLACKVWRVGTRLSGELSREDVAARVREVMRAAAAGEEVAQSAAKWRDMADKAAGPGGTSHGHMRMMVEAMVEDAAPDQDNNKAESFSPCSCAIL